MWVRVFAILLFASQVLSAKLDARDVVGSCRYEKTSVAVLTCLQPGGKWSPPSTACCKALLYAIDQLPGSGESGACCLCRQGKDKHIVNVNRWTFPFTSCYRVCPGNKGTSSTQKDRPVVHAHGASNTIFMIITSINVPRLPGQPGHLKGATFVDRWISSELCIAAAVVCLVLLVCCWYLWWAKPAANSTKSSQSAGGPFLEAAEHRRLSSGRRDSAQLKLRRTSSSRSSPNS
ncbi:uncharacterized protein [Lolium perenne]|uniref:uncharacterized protein n=1 Tax=Lolium perenne TaxID=4522 RepID=UPI003A999D78